MEKLEELSVKTLYRCIMKGMKTYPSTNRAIMTEAIREDVRDWVQVTEEDEKAKNMKKLRMLYGHVTMWNIKMDEVNRTDTERVDQPLPFKDINHKKDKDFVYF